MARKRQREERRCGCAATRSETGTMSLLAAVRAFTKDAKASLEGIAKAAGVGIGTLYFYYPTSEARVEA